MKPLSRCHEDWGGQVDEVSEANSISKWARDYSCETLAKKVTVFCPCPKDFLKAKLKSTVLISLVEEILGQPRIGSFCIVTNIRLV